MPAPQFVSLSASPSSHFPYYTVHVAKTQRSARSYASVTLCLLIFRHTPLSLAPIPPCLQSDHLRLLICRIRLCNAFRNAHLMMALLSKLPYLRLSAYYTLLIHRRTAASLTHILASRLLSCATMPAALPNAFWQLSTAAAMAVRPTATCLPSSYSVPCPLFHHSPSYIIHVYTFEDVAMLWQYAVCALVCVCLKSLASCYVIFILFVICVI